MFMPWGDLVSIPPTRRANVDLTTVIEAPPYAIEGWLCEYDKYQKILAGNKREDRKPERCATVGTGRASGFVSKVGALKFSTTLKTISRTRQHTSKQKKKRRRAQIAGGSKPIAI